MWPDGKKHSRNVYAKTREECEALLPGLIEQMKAVNKAIKESRNLDAIPDGISEKKKAIAAYMREHPEVTSKSAIAKAVGTDRNTVRKYYDEIRSELGLKNPVISMIWKQQAKGFYPIKCDSQKDHPAFRQMILSDRLLFQIAP